MNKKIIIGGGIILIITVFVIFSSLNKGESTNTSSDASTESSDNIVVSEVSSTDSSDDEIPEDWSSEGEEYYEVGEDEEENPYTVTVENIGEMADQYDDLYNTMNLKYYIQQYLNKVTDKQNEECTATLVEGSCEYDPYKIVMTFDAVVDKYPDVVLHIEYSTAEKMFGISSELGDYSLAKRKEELSNIKNEELEEILDVDESDNESTTDTDAAITVPTDD